MNACVVVFPGLNGETEMVRALELAGAKVRLAWHKEDAIAERTDLVVIPGGFSFGDYLRPGAIAATCRIMKSISAHASRGGYVLGVCNGFHILTEARLLPGALRENASTRFACRDVLVRSMTDGPFSPPRGQVLRLPIAHGHGQYCASAQVLDELERDGRIAFAYCDESGALSDEANPNGSLRNIAGVYGGPHKNILGLMPHPERMTERALGGTWGLELLQACVLRG